MQVKLLIKALETLPSDAIVQISSCQHEYGSEDIVYISVEDEHNNKTNFNGQVYVWLVGGYPNAQGS